MTQRRVMKSGDQYLVEEKDRNRNWQVVCCCYTITEAKEILKTLRLLEKESKNDKKDR